MPEHIPVFRPSLDWDAVARELRPVIESGWLGQGPKVEELEAKLAAKVGAKYFICTSSGTAALHLAVHCLDLPRGSRVLTTPITFVSTNAVLLWGGLVPVFGEVTRDGMLKGPHGLHSTVATMVVHLGGARCDLADGASVAANWPVIEDCAHAFGAPWLTEQGPNMRCWSFHAVKNLPMGDGGGISTNDPDLAIRLKRLRWMGIDKSTHARSQAGYSTEYDIQELGWKYAMNDISAAIGLAALPYVDEQVKRRQWIARVYIEAFDEFEDCRLPEYEPENSACHFCHFFFTDREKIEAALRADNIGFTRHYRPNFMFDPFRLCPISDEATATACEYWRDALVLPIFPSMTDAQVDRVIAALKEGRVNGSSYTGDCTCLVGTIANARHCAYNALPTLKPNPSRPAERFFLGISKGDTPKTNQFSKLAVKWADEWLTRMRAAFAPSV